MIQIIPNHGEKQVQVHNGFGTPPKMSEKTPPRGTLKRQETPAKTRKGAGVRLDDGHMILAQRSYSHWVSRDLLVLSLLAATLGLLGDSLNLLGVGLLSIAASATARGLVVGGLVVLVVGGLALGSGVGSGGLVSLGGTAALLGLDLGVSVRGIISGSLLSTRSLLGGLLLLGLG